jgi:hypothetical protein
VTGDSWSDEDDEEEDDEDDDEDDEENAPVEGHAYDRLVLLLAWLFGG